MPYQTKIYRDRIYSHYVHATQGHVADGAFAQFQARAPYLKRLIHNHFPQNKDAQIIDLGCGAGALVYFAQKAGYRNIRGVDYSKQQIQEATSLQIDGVQEADLLDTLKATPQATQDLIVTYDVIEHFTKTELIPFVDQIYKALKPGGAWIIHTVNAESPFFGRVRYGDYTHEQAFTRQSLYQVLFSSGFADIQAFEDAPVVHGFKSAIRGIIWKGLRALLRVYLMAETGSGSNDYIFSQNFLTVARRAL